MYPTHGQKRALRSLLENPAAPLHPGTLAALKASGWIQAPNAPDPTGTDSGYQLTPRGQRALDLRAQTTAIGYAKTIGLESETCEECGGSGELLVLDERDLLEPCPWCDGNGLIL